MANKYCIALLDKIPEQYVVKVVVPTGQTYYAGEVVLAKVLSTVDSANLDVYASSDVADATIDVPAIILSQGFETISATDTRRPAGNSNIAEYAYYAGQVLTAVRLDAIGLRFFISTAALVAAAAPAVGETLTPTDSTRTLTDTDGSVITKVALNVDKLHSMPAGGNHDRELVAGVVARVVSPKSDTTMTDIQTALNLKASIVYVDTADDLKADAADLTNVENTADLDKVISTATQTALDLKADA